MLIMQRSGNRLIGWKRQLRPLGSRPARGGAQYLRLWLWAGQKGCAPEAQPPTVWRDGMQTASLTAMVHLDDIETWSARAEAEATRLTGRTPPLVHRTYRWSPISAPIAKALTCASRAAVQRNLAWMEAHGLIREMTGQARQYNPSWWTRRWPESARSPRRAF